MAASKWDFLDALSHTEWRFPADITFALSKTHGRTALAQVMLYIEDMENDGYVETRREGKRLGVRKTQSGIKARLEVRAGEKDSSSPFGLKTA
jgi:DNA-binding PadR family transcriptional regulator